MMGSSLAAHRSAARLARRELRRRPWRTALVVLLVALPVAAMVLGTSLLRTGRPPFDLEDRAVYGLADARVSAGPPTSATPGTEPVRDQVLAAVPGAHTVLVEEVRGSLQGPVGKPRFVGLMGPADDPMVTARTTVRRGRLPRGAGEVAVSPRLADAWQLDVGSTLDLPTLALRATVVGIAHPLVEARTDTINVGAMPDIALDQRSRSLFIRIPGDVAAVDAGLRRLAELRNFSVPGRHRAAVAGNALELRGRYGGDAEVWWSMVIGALALAVSGIVIGAAFAVGARRQLRTLGILASNGASPAALRSVVLWQGAWAGLVGAGGGVLLGLIGLAAAWPWHDRFLSYEPGWFTVRVTDVVIIAALGILTAVMASHQPARSVSRLSIITSLAGRRPIAPVRRRVVLAGVAVMATGTGFLAVATVGSDSSASPNQQGGFDLWAAIAVLGGLGLLFGSAAVAPGLVGIFDPIARRLRGSPLLALRSLGRQRARTGAVVAAVAAAAALAVSGSAVMSSVAEPEQTFVPDDVVLLHQIALTKRTDLARLAVRPPDQAVPVEQADAAAVAAILPTAARLELTAPRGYLIATPEVIDAFRLDATTQRLLREHGAVRPRGGEGYPPELTIFGPPPEVRTVGQRVPGLAGPTDVPGTVIGPRSRYRFVNQATLISVERAASLQLTGDADPMVAFVSPTPLTADQRDALRDLEQNRNEGTLRLASTPGRSRTAPPEILQVLYVTPPEVSPLLVYAILDGIALLFTGFVIVVGLALAAAETREEVEVLTAVGASPSTLRRLAGAKAALLALSGVALAIPTGLIPVWVVRNASAGTSRFIIPWPSLGLLLVALPAAMAVLALGGSAVHARLRPITASTMTTD